MEFSPYKTVAVILTAASFLFISPAQVEGQGLLITGRVVDSINRDPVAGATVNWNGGAPTTTTNAQGLFTLSRPVTSIGSGSASMQFEAPYFRAGHLRFESKKSRQTVEVSVYNSQGETMSSHRFVLSNAGIQDLAVLPEGKGYFLGFVSVRSEGESYRFKVMHQGGPVPLTNSEFIRPAGAALARSAAGGTVNASMVLLNSNTANTLLDTANVGDIVLGYPVRPTVGVGARPPWGTTMLFDGSQGRAAGNAEMQAKWMDWPRFSTPSPIMFRITRDPQYLSDTNRVTMQSCCNTLWGYDDIQAKVGIFQDVQVHAEFNTMGEYDAPNFDIATPNANVADPFASGQPGYANSGVYVVSRYEIQIQSFAQTGAPGNHDMGAIVNDYVPTSNQNRPNGTWQAYDITYRGARFTGTTMTSQPYMTVWWNGVQVHLNRAVNAAASGLANHSGEEHTDPTLYGLKLQSEGRDVRFRNVWVKKLTLPTAAQTNYGF